MKATVKVTVNASLRVEVKTRVRVKEKATVTAKVKAKVRAKVGAKATANVNINVKTKVISPPRQALITRKVSLSIYIQSIPGRIVNKYIKRKAYKIIKRKPDQKIQTWILTYSVSRRLRKAKYCNSILRF